ncbi:hypothetical protein H2204_006369 [Knufia peltigerae]|uniref:SET domain-containing protein n=1 Tax=Knufia peltigerae TaxID=1002370 RepID=A0AA39CXZ1_9EURO|nr:hypothetical protein H2204_006369 [Knufia peltigerae]
MHLNRKPDMRSSQHSGGIGLRSALFVLAQALFVARCFSECITVIQRSISITSQNGCHRGHTVSDFLDHLKLKEYAERALRHEKRYLLQEDTWRDSGEQEILQTIRKGDIKVVAYPWFPEALFRRSENAIQRANNTLEALSQNKLVIKKSRLSDTLRSYGQIQHDQDAYGIFAMTDIPADTKLFLDKTILCATDGSYRCTTCCADLSLGASRFLGKLYCDRNCFRNLRAACGLGTFYRYEQDLGETVSRPEGFQSFFADHDLEETTGKEEIFLFQRALEVVYKSTQRYPGRHPLQTRMLNYLTARYHDGAGASKRFSYTEDVCLRFEFLQKLGVDIFQDELAEAWVLETLANRIQTNMRGYSGGNGDDMVAVNTMYAFFNHSCQPNVKSSDSEDEDSAICVTTTRKIERGEELYVSYLSDEDLREGHDVREEKLRPWTGGMCLCRKCSRERRRTERPVSLYNDENRCPSQ